MILRRHHFKFDSLFLNKLQFVVLSSHSRYLAQRECTVGVLYDFVAYECSPTSLVRPQIVVPERNGHHPQI